MLGKVRTMNSRLFRVSVLLGAGLLALTGLPRLATAQDNSQEPAPSAQQPAPSPRQGMHGQRMLERLNLTDDQKAQIKKIHEDARAKMDAIRTDSSLSDAERKAKIQEIRRSTMRQVHAVLTPEQRQQLREEMRQRRAARHQQQPS